MPVPVGRGNGGAGVPLRGAPRLGPVRGVRARRPARPQRQRRPEPAPVGAARVGLPPRGPRLARQNVVFPLLTLGTCLRTVTKVESVRRKTSRLEPSPCPGD